MIEKYSNKMAHNIIIWREKFAGFDFIYSLCRKDKNFF